MSTAPFTDSIDYPGEMLIDGPREGVFYDYAGSWYLDGIVNFTDPFVAFMLMRYEDSGHAEAIAAIAAEPVVAHVCRHDDVVLLRTSHGRTRLWLFYFDRDSSDCAVGWVANTEANLAAMLSWVAETADNAFANYQPDATRPEGGVLLEIPKMARCVQW